MSQHADDVAELIRHLGLQRPVLVGQSLGGQVIISAAARHPELVGAVASLDSPSNIPGWHQRFHEPFDHLIAKGGPLRETVQMFLSAAYLPTDDPSRLGGMAARLAEVPDHVIFNSWHGKSDFDPGPMLRRLKCPYLYIDCGQPDLGPGSAAGVVPAGGDRQDSGRRTQGSPGCAGPDQCHAQPVHPTRRRHRRRNDPHQRSLPIQLPRDLKKARLANRTRLPGWFRTFWDELSDVPPTRRQLGCGP